MEQVDNIELKKCPACDEHMSDKAWKCKTCGHAQGWHSFSAVWVPILSLLIALTSLIPAAKEAIFPVRGSFNVEGNSNNDGNLAVTFLSTNKKNLWVGNELFCTGDYKYKDESAEFLFRLVANESTPIIAYGASKIIFRPSSLIKTFGTGVVGYTASSKDEVIVALAEESVLQGFSCRLSVSDDIGKIKDDTSFDLWLEERHPNVRLELRKDPDATK